MSEYQYYEFQAIDRPLTDREMAELRALSTRARITSTSFVNTYQWGDFKGRPDVLMEKYFDAFVYFANWGTRILKFRLPRRLVDLETASVYCRGDGASLKSTKDVVVFSFCHDREPEDDWDENGEGVMASLIPLRDSVLDGDLRPLYLGWLLCVQQDQVKGRALEPPVPPGLGSLEGPVHAFADFLQIDRDLIEAAAQGSPDAEPSGLREDDVRQWVQGLPVASKDDLLLRLAVEEGVHLRAELLQKYRHSRKPEPSANRSLMSLARRRTVGDLLAAAEGREAVRLREAAERASRERERRKAQEAAARAMYLRDLAKGERRAWAKVDALIARRQPTFYGQAVTLLKDLGEVCEGDGRKAEFKQRIRQLREKHSRKPTFISRLNLADIGGQ